METFGRYRLERKLASGGMAEVLLGTLIGPEGFERRVAIKRILPHLAEQPEFVHMFLDEARLAARFSHPNLVQILDLGEQDGRYFLAMEYVHGLSVRQILRLCQKNGHSIPLDVALKILSLACEGLDHAHRFADPEGRPLGLVHRDISPHNLMLSYDGQVKVLDFGIAKAAGQLHQTRASAVKGKAAYMAPEQIRREPPLDARADVWSLGVCLYEMLTGRRPFQGDGEVDTMLAVLEKEPEDPRVFAPGLPPMLTAIIRRCLSKERERRPPSAWDLHDDVERALDGLGARPDPRALAAFLHDLAPPEAPGSPAAAGGPPPPQPPAPRDPTPPTGMVTRTLPDTPPARPSWLRRLLPLLLAGLVSALLGSVLLWGLGSEPASVEESGAPAAPTRPRGMASLSLDVDCPVRVWLDGKEIGAAEALRDRLVPPGRHRLRVLTDQGQVLLDEDLEFTAGESKNVKLFAARAPPARRR